MKQKWIKKTSMILGMLLLFCLVMLVLSHSAKNGRETTQRLPVITESPVYVKCVPGQSVEAELFMKEDISISGLQILLVNLSEDSRGSLLVSIKDEQQNCMMETTLPVNTISAGKWFAIPGEVSLEAGKIYTVSFLSDASDPYFMQVSKENGKNLPFEQKVYVNGQLEETGISIGMDVVTPVNMTFGEIFYYSVPFSVLLLIVGIFLVLFGKEKIAGWISKIPVKSFLERFGNDLFLLLLFLFSCLGIYAESYMKGVYISADSAGYLREAVNIVNGNGFYYDAMAGYDNWFANWPILYPLLIAAVMAVTGMNAYLASKILMMLLVLVILIMLRVFYKKEAWIYALCVLNIGFITLTYYTWSEIPFMVFLLLFAMLFSKIVQEKEPGIWYYIGLGFAGMGCFLTRYVGAYVWIVTGVYILYYGWQYYKRKEKPFMKKAVGLTVTAALSGFLSLGYLLMNKIMNGMASGVSRTLWWDDYEKLTNDLIQSLLTEICNVFSIQIPDFINAYPYHLKVILLGVILVGLAVFIYKTIKWESVQGVMVTFGISYYIIFIAIRYLSSMDSFYFRFFEPASFLICLGLFGALLPYVKKKAGMPYFAVLVTTFIMLSITTRIQEEDWNVQNAYYHELTAQWDKAYAEIPEKSVVIFSDLDFRSSYYRPDVIGGDLRPEYTFDQVKQMYAGSDYLCIKKEYVKTMLESGEYDESVAVKLQDAMRDANKLQDNKEYAIISLRNF